MKSGLLSSLNFVLFAAVAESYSIDAKAQLPRHVPWGLLLPYFIIGIPFLLILAYMVGNSIKRYSQAREKKRKAAVKISEFTTEELEKLYGGEYPEEFASLDRMSREELRMLAKKELEKQGRKIGEIDYLKGPLDWEDVDENFKPRPKVIRSDISKTDLERSPAGKEEESVEKKDNKEEQKEEFSPPPEILE